MYTHGFAPLNLAEPFGHSEPVHLNPPLYCRSHILILETFPFTSVYLSSHLHDPFLSVGGHARVNLVLLIGTPQQVDCVTHRDTASSNNLHNDSLLMSIDADRYGKQQKVHHVRTVPDVTGCYRSTTI